MTRYQNVTSHALARTQRHTKHVAIDVSSLTRSTGTGSSLLSLIGSTCTQDIPSQAKNECAEYMCHQFASTRSNTTNVSCALCHPLSLSDALPHSLALCLTVTLSHALSHYRSVSFTLALSHYRTLAPSHYRSVSFTLALSHYRTVALTHALSHSLSHYHTIALSHSLSHYHTIAQSH